MAWTEFSMFTTMKEFWDEHDSDETVTFFDVATWLAGKLSEASGMTFTAIKTASTPNGAVIVYPDINGDPVNVNEDTSALGMTWSPYTSTPEANLVTETGSAGSSTLRSAVCTISNGQSDNSSMETTGNMIFQLPNGNHASFETDCNWSNPFNKIYYTKHTGNMTCFSFIARNIPNMGVMFAFRCDYTSWTNPHPYIGAKLVLGNFYTQMNDANGRTVSAVLSTTPSNASQYYRCAIVDDSKAYVVNIGSATIDNDSVIIYKVCAGQYEHSSLYVVSGYENELICQYFTRLSQQNKDIVLKDGIIVGNDHYLGFLGTYTRAPRFLLKNVDPIPV